MQNSIEPLLFIEDGQTGIEQNNTLANSAGCSCSLLKEFQGKNHAMARDHAGSLLWGSGAHECLIFPTIFKFSAFI